MNCIDASNEIKLEKIAETLKGLAVEEMTSTELEIHCILEGKPATILEQKVSSLNSGKIVD